MRHTPLCPGQLRLIAMCLLTIATFGANHCVAHAQEQEILLRVVDKQGSPLSGATVRFDYTIKGQSKRQTFPALTDSDGLVSVTTSSITLDGIDVSSDGHYGSWLSGDTVGYGELTHIPLNPVTNPLPLYARKVTLDLEMDGGQPVGFDFFAGDWVTPHGPGEVADLLFTPVAEIPLPDGSQAPVGFHLAVTFPNMGDGILPYPLDYPHIESDFPYPYVAPIEGYEPAIYFKYNRIGSILQPGVTPPPLYPFAFARIRTQRDADGRIASAHYLKLYPSIEAFLYSQKKAKVEMTYYLNQYSNNRNLEFQQDSNLYGDAGEPLSNLNLMEKSSYARKILQWPDLVDFLKKSHYRTPDEIAQLLNKP